MGIVRSGTQIALDRQVAIKTLRADHRTGGESLKLLQEAWVTGSLEHPNIVPIYDLGLDDTGAPVIVLKRIAGTDWARLLGDGAEVKQRFAAHDLLEWNLRVLLQVARAIELAHSRGILHRDIKPENIMVGELGEVYVLDWGIAVSLRPDEHRLPRAADALAIAGTPAYMAPEMLGGQALSPRTDVYLLGATLHEILTGRPPHLGATLAETLENVRLSAPLALALALGPAELVAVVQKAMAADPAARFGGVAELRAAVEAFLEHRSSKKGISSRRRSSCVASPSRLPSWLPASPRPRLSRERKRSVVGRSSAATIPRLAAASARSPPGCSAWSSASCRW